MSDDNQMIVLPKSNNSVRIMEPFQPRYLLEEQSSKQSIVLGEYQKENVRIKRMPQRIREDTLYIVSGVAANIIKRWNFVSPRSDPRGITRMGYNGTICTNAFVMHTEMPNDIVRRYTKGQACA